MKAETFYHIYTHANGDENLFRETENYRYFMKRYRHFIPAVADTYAYCLMPNHVHFLVRVKSENRIKETLGKLPSVKDPTGFQNLSGLISNQFGKLFNAYAKAYNKKYNRRGSLFTRAFKRKEIMEDHYLTKIIHYIHANPVHHGFVKKLEDWKWGSYHALLSDKPTELEREEIMNWYGDKEHFIEVHQQPIDLKLAKDLE
ncbi:MAG: hypothetical protein AAF363_02505 [Bacteroidota bacterium]